MINIVLIAVLLIIAAGAGFYLYKAKKRGDRCIGCPVAKNCQGRCGGYFSEDCGEASKKC